MTVSGTAGLRGGTCFLLREDRINDPGRCMYLSGLWGQDLEISLGGHK